MKLSRALLPTALAGALLLSGCAGGGNPTADSAGADCLAPGAASDAVTVSGDTGSSLKLDAKTPLQAKEMQRTVLTEGKGDVVKDGETISVSMSMFNGANGAEMQQVPASPVPFGKDKLTGWAYEGIRCAVPGQQIALVAPYADMFGETKPEQTGVPDLTEKDSIVLVMEFGEIGEETASTSSGPGTLDESELLKKAEGTAKDAPQGFPTVKLDKDGAPTITMPKDAEAPENLSIATLIEGDGETVEPGDRVYVNYRGVIWRTGEEFDSSWSRGKPADFLTSEVIGGFQQALEGQKVGSQVISVVPAEDGGYGAEWLKSKGYEPDDVMVFVLDILGTVHAE